MRNDMRNESHTHSHERGGGDMHSHGHDHGGHTGHAHPPMQPAVLAWAMAATLVLVIAEIFGGWLGHSVALLNDAARNLSDVPALGISWLAIGILVLWSSIGIIRDSADILLEGRPKEMGIEEVARAIIKVEGVMEVHDVHVWSLGGGEIAMSCHARVPDMHLDKCESLLSGIKAMLAEEFSIGHVTVQLERAGLPAQSGYVMPEPAKR